MIAKKSAEYRYYRKSQWGCRILADSDRELDSSVLLARGTRVSYVVEQVDDNSVTPSQTSIPKSSDELSNKCSGLRGIEAA